MRAVMLCVSALQFKHQFLFWFVFWFLEVDMG